SLCSGSKRLRLDRRICQRFHGPSLSANCLSPSLISDIPRPSVAAVRALVLPEPLPECQRMPESGQYRLILLHEMKSRYLPALIYRLDRSHRTWTCHADEIAPDWAPSLSQHSFFSRRPRRPRTTGNGLKSVTAASL